MVRRSHGTVVQDVAAMAKRDIDVRSHISDAIGNTASIRHDTSLDSEVKENCDEKCPTVTSKHGASDSYTDAAGFTTKGAAHADEMLSTVANLISQRSDMATGDATTAQEPVVAHASSAGQKMSDSDDPDDDDEAQGKKKSKMRKEED